MAMTTIIPWRNRIYDKAEVYDLDTIYFHQAIKENYVTKLLKVAQKELVEFLSKGIFELVSRSRVPEGEERLFSLQYGKLIKMAGTNKGYIPLSEL